MRVRVAAVAIRGARLLVQRPADDPTGVYAFPGGGVELGETLESRLPRELLEEAGARVTTADYLFVLEHRYPTAAGTLHAIEHYFRVEVAPERVASREPHLEFHWLDLGTIPQADVRPQVVRDVIAAGSLERTRHLIQGWD